MSGLRMNKVVRFSAAAGFLIAILLLLAISAGKKQVASTSSDHILSNRPPVIVVGGSLYGDAGKKWVRASTCQNQSTRQDEYCVDVSGDTNVLSSSQDYQDNNNNPINQTVTGTSWKIFIADSNPNSTQGIELCGNWDCTPGGASDAKYVYIRLYDPANSQWENNNNPDASDGNLYLKEKSEDCCRSYGHDGRKHDRHGGKCERPSVAHVYIGTSAPKDYKCTATEGIGCWVGVGKPPPSNQP